MSKFNGLKVFWATMKKEREDLSDLVTSWIRSHPSYEITELRTMQSSDQEFHCITIIVLYNEPLPAKKAA